MIKHCIIKFKDDELVCLLSEIEKPKMPITTKEMDIEICEHMGGEYMYELHQYIQSFKEYPIRDEDKEGFRNLLIPMFKNSVHNAYGKALSEGIEIDSSLVVLKWIDPCGIIQSGSDTVDCIQYATLKPTIKESLQVESDAIEFAKWIFKNNVKKMPNGGYTNPTESGAYQLVMSELYQIFLKTKT